MHWVAIPGAIPPHSWATCWVIFDPKLLSDYTVHTLTHTQYTQS